MKHYSGRKDKKIQKQQKIIEAQAARIKELEQERNLTPADKRNLTPADQLLSYFNLINPPMVSGTDYNFKGDIYEK